MLSATAVKTPVSDETEARFCNPCHEVKGQLVTSLCGYCTVCDNFLCTSCKEMHDHFPATRNHNIITGREFLRMVSKNSATVKAFSQPDRAEDARPADATVPENKLRGQIGTGTSSKTAPEILDKDGHDKAAESLSKAIISHTDSSVPESVSLLGKLNIRYRKLGSFNVKIKDDKKECWVTGIAITKTGRVVLVDNLNEKLKVFSKDMKFVSSLTLGGEPWDLSLLSDSEAVISMPENEQLLIIELSGSKPRIKQTITLGYRVYGVKAEKGSIIVACPYTTPPSVKRIDKKGKVKWSVDTFEGRQLFTRPWYITMVTSSITGIPTEIVVVTDCDFHLQNPRLVLLGPENGAVKGFRSMGGRNPYGIASDEAKPDFIYMCNSANEVAIISRDLSEEKTILTEKDGIIGTPQALAFSQTQSSLIMSYSNKTRSSLDCFQIE